MKRRLRARWQEKEAVQRVFQHLERLDRPTTSLSNRLELWRLIEAAAHDAWELEVWKMDSLNFAVSDPQVTSVAGVVVE